MKKTLLFLPVLALLFIACDAETPDKAIAYNDQMISIQSKVDQALVNLLDAIESFDLNEIEAARIESLDIIEKSLKEVDAMRDFDKKADFKNEMKKLFKMYKDITENELSEAIEIIGYEEMTDADWDDYDNLFDSTLEKYDNAFNDFNKFQAKFAKEWDFEVIKD